MIINIVYSKTWNSSISEEYRNQFYTYGANYSTTSIELANVLRGDSGAYYYVLNLYNNSRHTMFIKELSDRAYNWSFQYNFQTSKGNSVALDSSEQYLYNVDQEVNHLLEILKISAADGSLVANYQR